MAHQVEQQAAGAAEAVDEFAALLQKEFKPTNETARARIEQAVQTLAQRAVSDARIIGDDIFATVSSMRAEIDRKLSEQVNAILHNPEFQKLEAAWRGLNYLVMNTPSGADLKVRVMDISKEEIRRQVRQYQDAAWDQSPLFKKIYEDEFGKLGGHPFGAFVCDYHFDHTPPDVEVMRGLTKIGAAAHAPFIAGAAPSIMGMENWSEINNVRDIGQKFESTEYASWRTFRQSTDSRYLALAMPRTLGRSPYGSDNPIDEFVFEEETGGDHDKYLWTNAAYALGVRVTDAFKSYGWCTRIRGVEGGGTVENLPMAYFPTDDGTIDAKCPTEVAISDRRDGELSKAGFMALIHRKNTDQASFIGAQTVHSPASYTDAEATANANLSARLPYIFASCRFAHYLKCIVRDWVGSAREAPQLQKDLESWINMYVDGQPDASSEEEKARKPLKKAMISITPDEENPGYYRGQFQFVPHYQLEGMDVSISMVSKLGGGSQ